jgi:SAM-dependent methyltransferase
MQDEKRAGYYDFANPNLLKIMPADAATILEIGCGAGRLGAVYKEHYPQCRYVGVEINPEAAAIAATRLDQVLCGSGEEIDLGFLAGKVDCIVYGDVLEHLTDPWDTLNQHAKLLAPEGRVVTSIPNVQNWAVMRDLLFGRWNYTEEGLMDRTHLRFFTLDGVLQMFAQAGLGVELVTMVTIPHQQPELEQFVKSMSPALENFGINETVFRDRVGAFQYLVSGRKA